MISIRKKKGVCVFCGGWCVGVVVAMGGDLDNRPTITIYYFKY